MGISVSKAMQSLRSAQSFQPMMNVEWAGALNMGARETQLSIREKRIVEKSVLTVQ